MGDDLGDRGDHLWTHSVELRENALIVNARKGKEDEGRKYLHRGIANRAFERRFTLADHVRVSGASHANGMLHIDLTREVPEALKPYLGGREIID